MLIAAVVVLAVFGGAVYLAAGNGSNTSNGGQETNGGRTASVEPTGVVHEIVLTEDGYEPDTLEIERGDEVVFSTTRDEMFWPASNVHPTHRLYPAFDPEEPIEPDDEWSFVFDEPGEWRFHDHLAPFFTGVITVVE